MAIKNTLLGGTDWSGEKTTDYDLNDTFDAAVAYLTTLSTFWLNSDLYDVYDDFDSYDTGAFTTNTNWTVTLGTGSPYCNIVESQEAGGSGKELQIDGGGNAGAKGNITVTSKLLVSNKSTWLRFQGYHTPANTGTAYDEFLKVGLGNASVVTIANWTYDQDSSLLGKQWFYGDILVVALGSDFYDVYSGGKKIISNTEQADPQIKLYALDDTVNVANVGFYIDDVRQTKGAI